MRGYVFELSADGKRAEPEINKMMIQIYSIFSLKIDVYRHQFTSSSNPPSLPV